MFSALHFNGEGSRLKIHLVVGYVEPLKLRKKVQVMESEAQH